jgi:hypothetical protein
MFISMLEFLRDFLLSSSYTECMRVLMKFPAVGDAAWFIKKAYNLRDPFSYPRPSNFSYSNIIAKQQRAAQARMARQANVPSQLSSASHTKSNNSILTMVAGKQSGQRDVERPSESSRKTLKSGNTSHKDQSLPPMPSVSSVLSSGLSRFMSHSGNEVILGTADEADSSKQRSTSPSLFTNTQVRHRAESEGNQTKRMAGIAKRVSSAEEALPPVSPVDEQPTLTNEEVYRLRRESDTYKNHVNDLECKLSDVQTLIHSCILRMNLTLERVVDNNGKCSSLNQDAIESFKDITKTLTESLIYCDKDGQVKKDMADFSKVTKALSIDEKPVPIENGEVEVAHGEEEPVSLVTLENVSLDETAREVLQAAMEEAIEATETTAPHPVEGKMKVPSEAASHGLSVSPSSDSDYSMVDANDEYIIDIVENCEKKV